MGVLMEFSSVRADTVTAVQEDPDFDLEANDAVVDHADFSLHLDFDALDELVAAACEVKQREPFTFDEAMGEQLSGTLSVMSGGFVDLFASLEPASFLEAARPWLGDALTPDFRSAIEALITLCRNAKARSLAVVFFVSP